MKYFCPLQKKKLTKEKLPCTDCHIRKSVIGCKTYNAVNNEQTPEKKIEYISEDKNVT